MHITELRCVDMAGPVDPHELSTVQQTLTVSTMNANSYVTTFSEQKIASHRTPTDSFTFISKSANEYLDGAERRQESYLWAC